MNIKYYYKIKKNKKNSILPINITLFKNHKWKGPEKCNKNYPYYLLKV